MAKAKIQAVYQKEFPIGTASNYYDEGTINVAVQGRKPVSVGWQSNQVSVVMYQLRLLGDTLYYGRRALSGDLTQNTAVFIVTYV